jgi:cytochrome b6-f complex iron-sulfur subunit
MGLVIAIVVLVLLAVVVLFTTVRRRDTHAAIGGLSRETVRRDRSDAVPDDLVPVGAPAVTGREVERAAALERREASRAVVVAPAGKPVPVGPVDPETLGVTRRQFLNRGIVNMMLIGLGGFGAACLAFLNPSSSGGFGGKVPLPDGLSEILDKVGSTKEPYYYAPGRVYVQPYPKSALAKAKKIYTGSVLLGMEHGIVALYQKCVHLGCRVPWCKSSQWFECPCHGSKYNRVGEKKGGPAPRGLDRFAVLISGNKVTVNTGLITLGPPIGTNTTGQEAEGPHCVTVGE